MASTFNFDLDLNEFETQCFQTIDNLFASKYDPICYKEENYVNYFTRFNQGFNELLENEILFESYDKKVGKHELWEIEKAQVEAEQRAYIEVDKEYQSFEDVIKKTVKLNEHIRELEQDKADYTETEEKLQLVENDTNELKKTHQTQMEMIKALQSDDEKRSNVQNDSELLQIGIVETLLGLRIFDSTNESEQSGGQQSNEFNRFDIMFLNLPDDCLNLESSNLPGNKPFLPQHIKLSAGLIDKYRAIHKKRKMNQMMAKNALNGLIVNNPSDFKAVYENFQTLLCSYLTKQEIEKAGKRFGLDWIEGSPVISIIIDTKATKMATIVLPKYYPLCGTSMIKLTSLTGYENSTIKNFRIDQNLGSLVEWIERFIDLYNTNQLEYN